MLIRIINLTWKPRAGQILAALKIGVLPVHEDHGYKYRQTPVFGRKIKGLHLLLDGMTLTVKG